jgi:uncharacterized protein YjlB
MSDRPHIFLATPCFGGLVTTGYMQSVLGLVQTAGEAGFDLTHALLGHDALITRCRSTLLGSFMDSAASHLLFVDSDIVFTPGHVVRLLRAGKDFVAGMYPIKSLNWDHAERHRQLHAEKGEAACLLYVGKTCEKDERENEDGLVTAIYAGTGFMMVTRAAVARMIAAYPQTRYRTIHAWPLPTGPERERHALFDTMILPDTGEYLSEDYAFCHRWRAIGGRIWLDTRSRLTHIGSFEYHGNPAARFAVPEPAFA